VLKIGSREAKINGKSQTMLMAVVAIRGVSMVPLRFISEGLGCTYVYDKANGIVTITSGK
jgi:hypothetical protein